MAQRSRPTITKRQREQARITKQKDKAARRAERANRPANTFVAGFMGSPRMNLLPARLANSGSEIALEIQNGGHPRVRIELPPSAAALSAHVGRDVIAGIRAEAVSLARDSRAPAGMQREIDAKVVVIEPTGADTLAVLDLAGHELTARLEPDAALKPGQDARFLVDVTKLVCFDRETQQLIA